MKYLEESLNESLSSVLMHMQERLMGKASYWGIPTLKNPVDFWVYQEIIFSIKPNTILEIGSYAGGSALAFAHMLDQLGLGKVISIDVNLSDISEVAHSHPRIEFLQGPAEEIFDLVEDKIPKGDRTLIIEDSSHEFDNTLKLLRKYAPLVSIGSYFIVEDGICRHGLDLGPSPGPYEASLAFVSENANFVIDRSREDHVITWNPCGYLKRIN
jgi:cephalosporin hydroxylase